MKYLTSEKIERNLRNQCHPTNKLSDPTFYFSWNTLPLSLTVFVPRIGGGGGSGDGATGTAAAVRIAVIVAATRTKITVVETVTAKLATVKTAATKNQ